MKSGSEPRLLSRERLAAATRPFGRSSTLPADAFTAPEVFEQAGRGDAAGLFVFLNRKAWPQRVAAAGRGQ